MARGPMITSYAGLKKELARRYPTGREAYQDGKASFIERALRMARSRRRAEDCDARRGA